MFKLLLRSLSVAAEKNPELHTLAQRLSKLLNQGAISNGVQEIGDKPRYQ